MKKTLFNAVFLLVALMLFQTQAMSVEYSDISKDHWAYKYITQLTKEGVLIGYPDETFKPDALATRAEFATMVVKSLHQQDYPITETLKFTDIDKDYWAWDMIQRAVSFDLVKGTKDNKFRPEDSVTRAEAITFAINALTTENISSAKAKEVLLNVYSDFNSTPEWFLITAGKAQILGLITKLPESPKQLNATKSATRADLAVLLFKMREEAKLNPNSKLREAMKPKTVDGYVLDSAVLSGYIATIPAGSKLPVTFTSDISSQTSKLGDIVVAKLPQNIVTKEKYCIFAKDSTVSSNVLELKKAMFIIRNGKLLVTSKTLTTQKPQTVAFVGAFEDTKVTRNFWQKLVRAVFKGQKMQYKENETVNLELLKPVKVDLTNGWIIE